MKAEIGVSQQRGLSVAVITLAAAAWLVTAWLHSGSGSHHLPAPTASPQVPPSAPGHSHHHSAPSLALPDGLATWYAGWLVMVVAMMLPPALPLLRTCAAMFHRTPYRRWLIGATTLGFLAVWAVAGAVLAGLGLVLRQALAGWSWLAQHPQVPAAVAAIAAGAYQFTGWKRACLTACRSPRSIAMTTWSGRRAPGVEALEIGSRFGAVCVGCCWALMVLTLTVAVAALPVMVAAAAAMAAERLVPRVRVLVPMIATAAITLGVLILIGVVAPGLRLG